jgi:hypothetical protein
LLACNADVCLITDPSEELINLAFSCEEMKVIGGANRRKLNGKTIILKCHYEANLLKQRMMNKRKYDNI